LARYRKPGPRWGGIGGFLEGEGENPLVRGPFGFDRVFPRKGGPTLGGAPTGWARRVGPSAPGGVLTPGFCFPLRREGLFVGSPPPGRERRKNWGVPRGGKPLFFRTPRRRGGEKMPQGRDLCGLNTHPLGEEGAPTPHHRGGVTPREATRH